MGGWNNGVFLGDGAHYNPTTNTWTAISANGAPSVRYFHTAVWTGSEMIIWGGQYSGQNPGGFRDDGNRYNPTTNKWTQLSTSDALSARRFHTAIWTGKEMIVWGGFETNDNPVDNGARYNPITNTWTRVSTNGAPSPRIYHAAIWTGNEMIIWGGTDFYNSVLLDVGARYSPVTNSWTDILTPTSRTQPTINLPLIMR